MKLKSYPNIPGVVFRRIPKDVINIESGFEYPLDGYSDDLFHGYAMSSDKSVWYGRGRPWRKVDAEHPSQGGGSVVVLHYFNIPGAKPISVQLLYDHIFGVSGNA